MNGRLRRTALWRTLRLAEHLATGVLVAVPVSMLALLGVPRPWLPGLVAWWHRRLLRSLAVRVATTGDPATGALVLANHVSWLDIPALGSAAPVRFVSKAEVRQWPVVGWLATLSGTLFLQRGAHQASAMAQLVAAELRAGATVAIFPEGTTSDGRAVQRFHARLLAAVDGTAAPVQPVAIRYGDGLEPDAVAPFVGDDSLLPHLWRVLRHPGLCVSVTFLPPIDIAGLGRRAVAERARDAIDAHLRRWTETDHIPGAQAAAAAT